MDDCILWERAVNSSGYGVVWKEGKQHYAHRIVVNAKQGEVVLHTCDNKLCVNPNHLVVGTHADNSKDMVSKGRQASGERCGNSKLTKTLVLEIRELKGVIPSRRVAEKYNISKTNILDIWNYKIWRN